MQTLVLTDCLFTLENMSSPYIPKNWTANFDFSKVTDRKPSGKPKTEGDDASQTSHQSNVSKDNSQAAIDQEVDNSDGETVADEG
jgi:hypothetical protein